MTKVRPCLACLGTGAFAGSRCPACSPRPLRPVIQSRPAGGLWFDLELSCGHTVTDTRERATAPCLMCATDPQERDCDCGHFVYDHLDDDPASPVRPGCTLCACTRQYA